jgi:hypothetical protein
MSTFSAPARRAGHRLLWILYGAILTLPTLFLGSWTTALPADADETLIIAARRGNPWINYADGSLVPSRYLASPGTVERLHAATPAFVLAADVNGDGFPDMVSGYSDDQGGLLAIHHANRAFRLASPTEERLPGLPWGSPFLNEVALLETDLSADFAVAGDFNPDTHPDLILASRGSDHLLFLPGSDKGHFGKPERVALPGDRHRTGGRGHQPGRWSFGPGRGD